MARKEQDHPFYKPLWRRVAIVAVILFWLIFEWVMGERGIWLTIAMGMLAYAVYVFFLTWPKETPKDGAKDDGTPPA